MKIAKVIEHCNECQFAKRFNCANANIDPLEIPDWCELEEYTGDKNISFFDE